MSNHNEIHSQTDQFIGQIDDFLLSKSTSGEIQNEMHNFLTLLGKIPQQEEVPEQQNVVRNQSLSIIYSISSEYSSRSDEQKQNMVYNMVSQMNSKIQEITKDMSDPDFRTKVKSIHVSITPYINLRVYIYIRWKKLINIIWSSLSNYLQHHKTLIQSKIIILNSRWRRINFNNNLIKSPMNMCCQIQLFNYFLKGSVNEDLYKMKSIESDLKRSLEQAQLFNENLSKLLKIKIEEQKYKDSQCKQIHTSLTDLNHELNTFQQQFYGINSNLKNLFERIQDIWAYNNQNNKANKLIEEILQDQAKFGLYDKSITDSIQTTYTTTKNSKLSDEKITPKQEVNNKKVISNFNRTPQKPKSKNQSTSNENRKKNQYATTTKKTSPKQFPFFKISFKFEIIN